MKLFLIRHGESQDAEESKAQSPNTPLSKTGLKQAKLLARSLKRERIDKVFSSHWPRAFETAKVVAGVLNKKVETSKLIHEREKNPEVYGVKLGTPEYDEYLKSVISEAKNLDWKYKGGGESTRDIINRAIKFRDHLLKNHLGETLIVISHGNFMRCFIGLCVLGDDYDDVSFRKFYTSFHLKNTGVCELIYEEKSKAWSIVKLNDFSHLRLVASPLLK